MATFPESSPIPQYPLILEPEFNTLVSNFSGLGGEKRRKKLLFPRYNITVNYNILTVVDVRTLYEFFMSVSGSYESFYIYDLAIILSHPFNHFNQFCGIGDGTTTIFDIPGRSTSSHTVYVDSVDTTVDATILIGGGSSDSDRVELDNAPLTGSIIKIDFTGFLRMKVRFSDDKLARINTKTDLYKYSIKLKGLSG